MAEDPKADVNVTPLPAGGPVVGTEERIEYRDENGRLLNDDEVKALEGKVSFSTRYETRTRLVDADGNEIYDGLVESQEGVAGTLAVGQNPDTSGVAQEQASAQPASVDAGEDVQKEESVESNKPSAEPESDAGSATGKDEL